jgi:hypothetical protein
LPVVLFGAGGVISEFSAVSLGQEAVLNWTVGQNTTILKFNVQRSFDGRRFYTIADVQPVRGVYKYSYTDDDLYKDNLHTYYYRIEAVLPNNVIQYSSTEEVRLSFSGIKRTWGSIKAMFK